MIRGSRSAAGLGEPKPLPTNLRRWYPLGVLRTSQIFIASILLLAIATAPAIGRELKFQPYPELETGTATVEIDGRTLLIDYSRTFAGPLFALQPLVAQMGGTLEVGPLGQRHELEVTGTSFLFGPGGPALTNGENIEELSQPPGTGSQGLMVPLDLLRRIYTQLMGFDLAWAPETLTLKIARQPLREIPVTLDVVSLQGVTTLVFQFPIVPRYRIERSASRITVGLIGDRLDVRAPRLFAADQFVRDVRLSPQKIVIDLSPQTQAQDYALEEPFRLVFDVLRDTGPQLPRVTTSKPQRRGRRIETIVIDPGHGGRDTGAIGPAGTQEKRLTLSLARSLRRQLESRLPVRAILTRNQDTEIPLDTRSAIANQNKGDLFISIHLNSSPRPSSTGAETYFLSIDPSDERAAESARLENQAGEKDPLYDLQLMLWDLAQTSYMTSSQRLAGFVQAELNSTLGLRNRGVKQAPFRVLVGAAMPAVLVEFGFLSNPNEEKRLLEASYREDLVDSLVRAVSRYVAETEGKASLEDDTSGGPGQ
jgi:N-acetylmuramoyl-L-alanine amidase